MVDQRPEPQRVEIELTSHEPVTQSARPVGATAEHPGIGGSGADPVPTVSAPTEHDAPLRRLVLGGGAIAVTALIAGVMVGRMGGTSGPDVDSAASVVAVTTSVPADVGNTLPAAAAVEPASPSTTTRTEPPAPAAGEDPATASEGRIDVHPSVSAADTEIVALTNGGELVRIDAATGATATTEVDVAQLSVFGPPTVLAGAGWILVPSYEGGGESTVLFDDGSRSSIDAGSAWPLLTTGSGGQFWRADGGGTGGFPDRLVEITIDGDPTGAEVQLNGFFPRMVDPLGGVVADAPGGSYVLMPGSATRITQGRVLALGRERAVFHECDERLDCSYLVIERATGERRELTLDPEVEADLATAEVTAWWAFDDPWNGSEDAVLILSWNSTGNGTPSFGVIDLSDGEYTRLGDSIDVPTVRWSGDQSLFWLDRGQLRWFDRTTEESVLFSDELDNLAAFTLRATAETDSR